MPLPCVPGIVPLFGRGFRPDLHPHVNLLQWNFNVWVEVGPNIQEITVAVQARLPANGVVFLIFFLIAPCCAHEAPCA